MVEVRLKIGAQPWINLRDCDAFGIRTISCTIPRSEGAHSPDPHNLIISIQFGCFLRPMCAASALPPDPAILFAGAKPTQNVESVACGPFPVIHLGSSKKGFYYIYIHMYIITYTYIYVYTYIYTHNNTHIYTYAIGFLGKAHNFWTNPFVQKNQERTTMDAIYRNFITSGTNTTWQHCC